jgi:5-oxoprolinase (ATP-hydrolysing)
LDEHNNGLLSKVKVTSKKTDNIFHAAALELFTNRFTAIANEMGALLQRASFSVNIKERLDFSCAILDHNGFLVVNAPHVPVHLGSLGVCVREVMKLMKMKQGDVIITNHPAFGGSHLPDITLISPVYVENECIAYVANRAHHAEVGGTKPGSMPADAKYLYEEGVIISPTLLADEKQVYWNDVEKIFTSAKYPTRAWTENQADLNAALASVRLGVKQLQTLCKAQGKAQVKKYLQGIQAHAADLLAEKLKNIKSKKLKAKEFLDDGSCLSVSIEKKSNKLQLDFNGTSAVHPGNMNATAAIVNSVVLYVLRVWLNEHVPLNEGLLKHIQIKLPLCLLNPGALKLYRNYPAVVGGNTEVSQRLTDTLFKAFQLAACSQGTMNNLLFGNSSFGYYETICGGTGAGKGFAGTDAVHSHMTNTRITDPEILEWRYPVRLLEFSIRKNSGGKGKWNGGNGAVRVFEFLEKLELSMLSQHRKEKPFGLNGGGSGKTGEQFLIKADGKREKLTGCFNREVNQSEILIIQTPSGGACG